MSKNTNKFLLECGCEEIPARFIEPLIENLKNILIKKLSEYRIHYSTIQTHSTYRRCIIIINDLAEKQEKKEAWIKGPPTAIAYDKKGGLTKAGEGFLKRNNISEKELEIKDTNNTVYIFF